VRAESEWQSESERQNKSERQVQEMEQSIFTRRIVSVAAAAAATLVLATVLGIAGWWWLFGRSCRVEIDCRGCDVEVMTLKRWEEQEKDGYLGILDLAGWRTQPQQMVSSISTGRREVSSVIGVYGTMELACPGKLLSGSYGIVGAMDGCVVSEGLADVLFGGADVAGELIRADGQLLKIAGVVEKEEDLLIIPVENGEIEYVTARMNPVFQAEERLQQLLEGR